MNEQIGSFHSRAACEERSAKCARLGDHRVESVSLFEEAWMRLGERLRHGTARASDAGHAIREIRHA